MSVIINKKTSKQTEIAALTTLLVYHKKMEFYHYEKIIFDTLVTHDGNKHLWIKKATGLGISEFMLRFMAWLCTKDNALSGSHMCIVTGPRIDLAIALIDRMKQLSVVELVLLTVS
jgi:late competence protein required for DNA uptake (superfamily II DNA/RNA helicase)